MARTRLDAEITNICRAAIRNRLTPGCVVAVTGREERRFWSFGRLTYDPAAPAVGPDTVYDVASVTKSVATACVVLRLAEEGLLALDDPAVKYLPELKNDYRNQILIRHLLSYSVIFELPQRLADVAMDRREQVLETVLEAPLAAAPGQRFDYSNAPFLLLGLIAERVGRKPIDALAAAMFFRPLKLNRTTFWPERLGREQIAPTEIDWRGEVWSGPHDETAWVLHEAGKAAGNAGLFSTAHDLAIFGQMLARGGELDGRRYFEPETINLMQTDPMPHLQADVSWGWRLHWRQIMGKNAHSRMFGKSGFTGCILLVDPDKERALVAMSNRTYPHRPKDGDREEIQAFWRSLAEAVFQ